MSLNVSTIRQEFPFFGSSTPSVYLDSAATTQKPQCVLDAMNMFYATDNANVHRGMHALTEKASVLYEEARDTVQKFVHAAHREEIIFTQGTTAAINLVAKTYGESVLQKGDTVVLSYLEHHSNIVPWLQLRDAIGVNIAWIDLDDTGCINMKSYKQILASNTVKLVAITMQSNVLGIRPPVDEMIALAHARGAVVLVDAAQAVAHAPIDVQKLDCDFLAFSGHKLYGPTGIGVLYGKKKYLQQMPAFFGGGMMIQRVTTDGFTCADLPAKFEAGTPPIAEAIGLSRAIQWLNQFSWKDIEKHEQDVLQYAMEKLKAVEGLHILPTPHSASHTLHSCFSFAIDNIHPHDLTDILGQKNIALRAGHHCAMPLHTRLDVSASTRLSIALYNTHEDIDVFCSALSDACLRLRKAN